MIESYFIDTALNIRNRHREHQDKVDIYADIVKELAAEMNNTAQKLMEIVEQHKKTTDRNELMQIAEVFSKELAQLEEKIKANEKQRHLFENLLLELDKESNLLWDKIQEKHPELSTQEINKIMKDEIIKREGL